MFNLSIQAGRLYTKPYIPHLDANNVREEFFEEDAFRAMLHELDEPIQPVAVFAYYLGWRSREITTLTWSQIDFKEKTVTLPVGTTKNKHGRLVVFPDALLDVIRQQRDNTSHLEKAQGASFPGYSTATGSPLRTSVTRGSLPVNALDARANTSMICGARQPGI
jgi:integrase